MDQYHDHCRDQLASAKDDSGWALVRSYWRGKTHFPAYIFFAIVAGMTISLVALDFIFNYWYYTYFYNALQSYNKQGFTHLLSFFFILSVCYLVLAIHRYAVSHLMGRQWLSNQLILHLTLKCTRLSNDFKKDMGALINASLDFTIGLVIAITTFSAFMYYLCLFLDEIAAQFGWPTIANYFILIGPLLAAMGTLCLIKQRRYLSEPPLLDIAHQSAPPAVDRASLPKRPYLALIKKNLSLWLLTGHSLIYVIFSLLLILPSYIEQLYLFLAVIYSLQTFLRGQHLFLYRFRAYFKNS